MLTSADAAVDPGALQHEIVAAPGDNVEVVDVESVGGRGHLVVGLHLGAVDEVGHRDDLEARGPDVLDGEEVDHHELGLRLGGVVPRFVTRGEHRCGFEGSKSVWKYWAATDLFDCLGASEGGKGRKFQSTAEL